MKKYRGLINPNKLKLEFLRDLFLIFSTEVDKNISLRNWNYVYLKNGHNITYDDLRKGSKPLIQNEDSSYRECTTFPEVLNITEIQYFLLDKVENMLYKANGLTDVLYMLNSFSRGTKRLKTNPYNSDEGLLYEWTNKNGNEKYSHKGNLPRAHFRWNYGERYTLSEEDLRKLALFIKPLIKYL